MQNYKILYNFEVVGQIIAELWGIQIAYHLVKMYGKIRWSRISRLQDGRQNKKVQNIKKTGIVQNNYLTNIFSITLRFCLSQNIG